MNTTNKFAHPMQGKHTYKIKGYPEHEIVFDYDEELFNVFRKGLWIGAALSATEAKTLVKTDKGK